MTLIKKGENKLKIITFIFNKNEDNCAMFCGNKKLELYTYYEGLIALHALEKLKELGIVAVETVYK